MSISVVINTVNEGRTLARCLKSVKDIADEIIIVDMESIDDSVTIAKQNGAKVFHHKRLSYVEPARNFGIDQAQSEWILILDPDEELPKTLYKKLEEIVDADFYTFVKIPRKNMIFGRWIKSARWWPDYNIRFFKKGYVTWDTQIHSVPKTKGKEYELPQSEEYALIHHHYESIEQFIDRMNRYTTVQSKNLIDSSYRFHWHDLVRKPADEFFSRYFFGEAYRDGVHGLALSALQAFSELVVYLKVWQGLKYRPTDIKPIDIHTILKKLDQDFHYWLSDFMVKYQGGLIHRVKRKLKIS